MYCRWCGKEIPDDSSFCPYCGKSLSDSAGDREKDKILGRTGEDADEAGERKKKDSEGKSETDKSDKKVADGIDGFYEKRQTQLLRMTWALPVTALAFAFLGLVPIYVFSIVILVTGLVVCLVAIFVLVVVITHLVVKKTTVGMYYAIFGGILTVADIVLLSSFLSACVQIYSSCTAGC